MIEEVLKQFWNYGNDETKNFVTACSPGRKLLTYLKLKSEVTSFVGKLKLSKIFQKCETKQYRSRRMTSYNI